MCKAAGNRLLQSNEKQMNMETLGNILKQKTVQLQEALQDLINAYEQETGVSVTALRIRFDESDCRKKVYMRTEYYDYEGALVNTPCDWGRDGQ